MIPRLTALALCIALAGCPAGPSPIASTIVAPQASDVIRNVARDADSGAYSVEVGGAVVEIAPDTELIYGLLAEGDLLLRGSVAGRPWYAALPAGSGGCFHLFNGSALNEGPTVVFPVSDDYALRLTKAETWTDREPITIGERYRVSMSDWCVSADGVLLHFEYGP